MKDNPKMVTISRNLPIEQDREIVKVSRKHISAFTWSYSTWLANIIPVAKRDSQVRVCIDFQDLNKATPKNDFPLLYIDVPVDSAARAAMYSFVDVNEFLNPVNQDKIKCYFI